MKTAFIVNTNAANGRCGRLWSEISSLAHQLFTGVQPYFTCGVGDGIVKTQQACSDGAELVISVGGDGTHNEVVNGLMRYSGDSPEYAILSLGTGGDLRKTVGWSLDPKLALAEIAGGVSTPVDVGKICFVDRTGKSAERFFGNIASIGIGGLVDEMVNTTTKILGGKASFFIGTLRATVAYRNQQVAIWADEEMVYGGRLYSMAVCNGQYFGGGMHIAPQANLSDGMFELIVMEDLSVRQTLALAPKIYKGKHIGTPGVTVRRCRSVRIETESDQLLIDLDGEAPGRMPGRFDMVPEALLMRQPGDSGRR